MKIRKKCFCVLVILFISKAALALGDFDFQVFLGLNASTADGTSFTACGTGVSCTTSTSAGLLGGVYVSHSLESSGLIAIRSGLVATQRVLNENYSGGSNGSFSLTVGYIDIPIHFVFRPPADKRFYFYGGGAYCSYTGAQVTSASGYFLNQGINTSSSNAVVRNSLVFQAGIGFDLQDYGFSVGYETNLMIYQGSPNTTVSSLNAKVGYLF